MSRFAFPPPGNGNGGVKVSRLVGGPFDGQDAERPPNHLRKEEHAYTRCHFKEEEGFDGVVRKVPDSDPPKISVYAWHPPEMCYKYVATVEAGSHEELQDMLEKMSVAKGDLVPPSQPG